MYSSTSNTFDDPLHLTESFKAFSLDVVCSKETSVSQLKSSPESLVPPQRGVAVQEKRRFLLCFSWKYFPWCLSAQADTAQSSSLSVTECFCLILTTVPISCAGKPSPGEVKEQPKVTKSGREAELTLGLSLNSPTHPPTHSTALSLQHPPRPPTSVL